MRHPRAQLDWSRRRGAVDHGVSVFARPSDSDQENSLRRIRFALGWQHDQRTVQPRRHLDILVGVSVIDERSRALRGQAHDERITRSNWRCDHLVPPAPVSDAVVITLELDAMPMDRRRRLRFIDDGDLGRLALTQRESRARYANRISRWRIRAFLQYVTVSRLIAVDIRLLGDEHAHAPP